MSDTPPTRAQLVDELAALHARLAETEDRCLRAEKALRDSEARFQAFLDHSPAVAFLKDRAGRFVYVNEPFVRLLGRSQPSILGTTVFDLFPAPLAEPLRANDERVWAGAGPTEAVEEVPFPPGAGPRAWLVTKFLVTDAAGQRFLGGIGIDVTDRRRAQDRLAGRERLFRAVIEAAGAVPYTRNYETDAIEYVGAGIEALLGCRPAAFTTELWHSLIVEVYLPGRPEPLTPAAATAALADVTSWHADVRARTVTGEERWLFNAAVKIADDAGAPVSSWGLLQDITERKRLEAQAGQAQKMEAVGRLAGGIAHDFNNLLTVINGYAELLLESRDVGAAVRPMAAEIGRAGARAAALTNQLLAFGRRQLLRPRVVGLNAAVAARVGLLRERLGPKVALVLALDPAAGAVVVDPESVDQVLLALAANARDAMPRGGTVTLETANVELSEEYARDRLEVRPGPYVRLAVRDTGVGMAADVRDRLFEPYFSTKGPARGAGLGLATVYGLVKQAGGHLAVESAPGAGTTFSIYLPRAGGP